MKKLATILTCAAAFVFAMPAQADYLPEGQTQRDTVPERDLLVSYLDSDQFVLSRLELRERVVDPVDHLVEIAAKSSHATKVRSRAIDCLALYRTDDRAVKAVSDLFDKTRKSHPLFVGLLMSYGQIHGEQGAEAIGAYLDARDRELRMAAVVALGRFGGRTGYDMLKERLPNEDDQQVQSRISSYVQ